MNALLEKLDELEAAAKVATPGNWYACSVSSSSTERQLVRSRDSYANYAVCEAWGGSGPNVKDAEFIAAANPATILNLTQALRIAVNAMELTKVRTHGYAARFVSEPVCQALASIASLARPESGK